MSLRTKSLSGTPVCKSHANWSCKSALAIGIGIALTGCASTEPVVDNSPIVRSATVVSSITNGGVKGQFASAGSRTVNTVENMRRADDAFKFTGGIMSRLGRSGNDSSIVRLDRGAIYQLDNKRKTYQECPVTGCPSFLDNLTQGSTFEEEQEQEDAANECQLTTLENNLTVESTGNQREINGFPTDEYLFSWSIVLQDPEGAKLRSEITSRTWTTPITGDVAQAIAMSDTFDQAFIKARNQEYPENLRKVMPDEALDVVNTFLLEAMSDVDAEFMQKVAAFPEIKGYPISTSIQWQSGGETCATLSEPEEQSEDTLDTGSVRGLLSSIGKQIVKQEVEKKKAEKIRELQLEPLFSYVETVDSITIEDIRSSKLDVPAGFKLVGRQ